MDRVWVSKPTPQTVIASVIIASAVIASAVIVVLSLGVSSLICQCSIHVFSLDGRRGYSEFIGCDLCFLFLLILHKMVFFYPLHQIYGIPGKYGFIFYANVHLA